MKVMCINDNWTKREADAPAPAFGDIDIVTEQVKLEERIFYRLERFDKRIGYAADHFAPLSDIDETELVNEKETAI